MASILKAQPSDSPTLARLHRETISWGLLSRLGENAVTAFYEALTRSNDAFCLLAIEDQAPIGFVSGIIDWRRARPQILRRMWWPLLAAAPLLLSSARWRRLLETGRYAQHAFQGIHAEFLTLGVRSEARGRLWTATALIHAGIREFRRCGVARIRGVVGTQNVPAMRFFEAVGFRHVSDVEIHPGEVSRMLIVDLVPAGDAK